MTMHTAGHDDAPVARPRNAATTREALLAAARPLFAEHGYAGTTVEQIARAAGFSTNLVTRYFGGKEGLFLAATRTGLHVADVAPTPAADFGRRLADHIVDRWEREGRDEPLLMLLRSASSSPAALSTLGDFLERESTAPIVAALRAAGLAERVAIDRANAIQSFILGTVVTRRMLDRGAVAAAGGPALRAWMAETLQRLVGDVPAGRGGRGRLPKPKPTTEESP